MTEEDVNRDEETRNVIYELSMPSKVVIMTPKKWMGEMSVDVERPPAIMRVNRQTHKETKEMFYGDRTFYICIEKLNFKPLIEWVERATSIPFPPTLNIDITLMHKMSCYKDLERFATVWRPLNHETVRLNVHSSYRSIWARSMVKIRSRDYQCVAVRKTISVAQMSKAAGQGDAFVLQELRSETDESEWSCGSQCREKKTASLRFTGHCSVRAQLDYNRPRLDRAGSIGEGRLRRTVAEKMLRIG